MKPEATPEVKPKEGETLLTAGDKKPAETPKAPEKYEDFKLPEGMKLEGETLTSAQALFKGLNLDQAQAQSLVDFHAAQLKAASEEPYKAMATMREGWQKEVRDDAEIGSKLAEVKTTVSRALDGLGDAKLAADFRAAMDLTGAGDHPAFIKAFYRLAQKVTEGKPVSGSGPSAHGQSARGGAAKPSAAQALYPNNP